VQPTLLALLGASSNVQPIKTLDNE
jgi:hypothetical protein